MNGCDWLCKVINIEVKIKDAKQVPKKFQKKFQKSSKKVPKKKFKKSSQKVPKFFLKKSKKFQKSSKKVQVMSPHHSDQMSQRSQVSKVALCMSKVKVASASQLVTRSPIELFWNFFG